MPDYTSFEAMSSRPGPYATRRDWAEHWAARGFPVFRLQENAKIPLPGSEGFYDATTDAETVRAWWTNPQTGDSLDWNIGMRPVAGVFSVIDLDVKEGSKGPENYEQLGGIIEGFVVETASGGWHVFYAGPDIASTVGKLAPGVDSRGSTGYVVAAGSVVDGVPYRIVADGPMLALPQFVLDRLSAGERDAKRSSVRYNIEADQPRNLARAIEEAKRAPPAMTGIWHDLGFRLGCEMARIGLSVEKTVEVLFEHWATRGTGFKSYDRFVADVSGGWHSACEQGQHGQHSVDAQLATFQGVNVALVGDGAPSNPFAGAVLPEGEPPASAALSAVPVAASGPAWVVRNPAEVDDAAVPPREFLVPGWLSPGHVTMLYADGGVGKSLLALQLMTALATGRPWLGLDVPQCRTFGLFCEDSTDELDRRQRDINTAMQITRADIGDMRYISGLGEENSLVRFDRDGQMLTTEGYARLYAEVRSFRPRLVVVDTAADVFDGNEVSRREVRRFIATALGRLARDFNAAVLLCGQPSRDGMKTGRLDGGSTAWNNTVRARWTLARPEGSPGEVDDNERVLTSAKSNYGRTGDTLLMRWTRGAFQPVVPLTVDQARARMDHAENVFLKIINRAGVNQGLNYSPHRNAGNYAPKKFAEHPDRDSLRRSDFETAMEALLGRGVLGVEEYGRASRPMQRLVLVAGRSGTSATGPALGEPRWTN